MSAYSIPSFIMVIVTMYVGLYHLLLFFRRNKLHQEDFTFSLCCLTMALYGIYFVGMYNAHSLKEGFQFQRGQVASLTLIGATFLWFVVDYLEVKEKFIRNFLSPFFIVSAIFIVFDHSSISFHVDEPLIKHILLPFNKHVTYFEVKPGIYVEVLSFMGMMVFVYAFFMAIRELRFGDKRKAKSMFGAVMIFCVGLINDASVHLGFYQFVYVIEYGYMGIVLLMATSLTNEVVESSLRKEALEESEKKYRELIDNSLVGIFIIQDHFIRFCNQQFAVIFGYSNPDEILGRPWSQFILEEDRDFVLKAMTVAQSSVFEHKQLEFRGILKNEPVVDIETFFGHILLNQCPAIQGTLIDITERKAAEKQLKESSDELKRYTIELEQFVNVTSHHLQEPLRLISSYVQLLAKRYQNKLDQKAQDYIRFAVQGVDRMHRLINDFLVYTRVGKQWQPKKEISLVTIVKRVIGHLNTEITENNAVVTAEALPFVIGEEPKLELLFTSLILNAIEFKKTDVLHVTIFTESRDGELLIGVKDDGIGISPEYHRLIFGMFQKLNYKIATTGTGIGLTISKKIVEQHQGQIWVESEEGKGATFYLTLGQMSFQSVTNGNV